MKYKRLVEVPARKAKTCWLCQDPWNEGDKIFILQDKIKENFELICFACGELIQKGNFPGSTGAPQQASNINRSGIQELTERIEQLEKTVSLLWESVQPRTIPDPGVFSKVMDEALDKAFPQ